MSASARDVLKSWWCASRGGNICSKAHLAECGSCSVCADDIISVLSSAGFVVVPREPTEEMMDAAYQAQINEANYEPWPTDPSGAEYVSEWVCARIAYRAMLSAAEGKK